jgi:origin recognition complex subunit 2
MSTTLKIQSQIDQEIPIHIVSTVDATAALKEEKLAQEQKTKTKKRFTKATGSNYLDLGLTVNNDKRNKPNNSSKRRKPSITPMEDMDEEDQMEETEESLSHHKAIAPVAMDNEDHDKENVDVSGRSIFKFQQAIKKSSNTMMKKALIAEEEEEDEEKEQSGRTKRVKKTSSNNNKKKQAVTTSKIDHAKRRRIERQMELLKDNRNSDDEAEAEEEHSSDEDEEEEREKAAAAAGNSEEEEEDDEQPQTRAALADEDEGYERYFQDLHTNSKTSNNTLSKLQVLEPQEFHQILQKAPTKHKEEIEFLTDMHKQHFPQWYFELQSGFNLIFYGYGSKRNLLNEFAESTLLNGPLIVVNGFFPSITIKDILLKITTGLQSAETATNIKIGGQLSDHLKYICDYFSDSSREYPSLYIVIHNLDGQNLRNEKTQTMLSILANSPNIHLIASIDHINAGLLWDNVKSSKFNWIWHDITTFDDYLVETSFENSLLIRTSELGGARGAKFVLDSLTSNARGVFKLLAEHQLTEMEISNMDGKGNESVGLSYSQYYQKCRENFFVSSDLALRTELTEFKDHKLISTKKTLDGTEIFYIPLDKSTLLSIIEQLD